MLFLALFLLSNCVLGLEQSGNLRSKKDAFSSLKEFGPSLGYRPPPPLVRRDAIMRVKYDPEKWIGESHMTISGAIMFDRTTGLTVDQCLEKCSKPEFQNPATRWICRSLTYDHKWKICDLYAIDGSTSPYFLSEYRHRDYFKFLAALPPTDKEYRTTILSKEMSAEIQMEEKKFESTTPTTTTTAFFSSKDFSMTTGSPSDLLVEPFHVGPSKQKLEGESAFNPFLHLDKFDSSKTESKEKEVIKALASKQTGDFPPLEQKEAIETAEKAQVQSSSSQLNEEDKKKSNTVEYYRKPTLKFAITPISPKKSGEEIKASSELVELGKEKIVGSIIEAKTESPNNKTTIVSEIIVQKEETTKNPIEIGPTTNVFEKLEEHKVVEVTADLDPIENSPVVPERMKSLKKKIQGITTYKIDENKPSSNGCKAGEVVRYIQIQEYQRNGNGATAIKKVDTLQARDCAEACTTENAFKCESAVFSAGKCSLYADSVDHASIYSLNKNIKATYLERVCLPARLANDGVNGYDAIRNYILVGQVQEVTDASTLAKCQIDCLTASETLGFQCKSAMFYPTDIESGQNCLLNSEDHKNKPDTFVSEDAGVNMIYFSMSNGEEPIESKKQTLGGGFQRLVHKLLI